MKHIVGFLSLIFLIYSVYFLGWRNAQQSTTRPTLKVFSSGSFSSKYGPGEALQNLARGKIPCEIQYADFDDPIIFSQRLNVEGTDIFDVLASIDLWDQRDLSKNIVFKDLSSKIKLADAFWKSLDLQDKRLSSIIHRKHFIPYNYSYLSFVYRKNKFQREDFEGLKDFVTYLLTKKISYGLIDPRSSNLGLHFWSWIFGEVPEDLRRLLLQKAKMVGANWSQVYGAFQDGQIEIVPSFVTSPLYHLLEEDSRDFSYIRFEEHPLYVEFLGINEKCRECQCAQGFVDLVLSPEGQKIIMEKNYMFPVASTIAEKTPFSFFNTFKIEDLEDLSQEFRSRILNDWKSLR